jgi:hypothetical protein
MPTVELRCEGTLHGRVIDGRELEVKCKRRSCGYRKGVVVLHTIDLQTGNTVSTKIFAEPQNQKGRGNHASHHTPAAVRAS